MSVPAAFDYHPATSVDEAIALLQQYGDDAKLLAGGHSLIPTMKLRLAQPGHLIDLGKIDGLSYIRDEGDVVAVGAMTRYVDIERSDLIKEHFELLPEGVDLIGDQQQAVASRCSCNLRKLASCVEPHAAGALDQRLDDHGGDLMRMRAQE